MQPDRMVAILTGASGTIGSLLSAELTQAGYQVVGVDRSGNRACSECLRADLSTDTGVTAVAEQLANRRVDLLINLAGVQYFGPFEQQDPARIRAAYAVNLIAPAILARAVLPQMLERGAGQIANIGSVMGSINFAHFVTYSSSKCGLRGLSEALRREQAGRGIAITHVSPRAVRTAFNGEAANRFMQATRMPADDPALVARRIATAISQRRKDVTIGFAENFYTKLNGVLPRAVDSGLARTTAKARELFDNTI